MGLQVNSSAEGDGWLMKLKVANASEADSLKDREAYLASIDH